VVIDRFLKMAILTVYKKNIRVADIAKIFFKECGSIFGYHRPSSLTGTTGSSTHFG
jgi:hypothetical protein